MERRPSNLGLLCAGIAFLFSHASLGRGELVLEDRFSTSKSLGNWSVVDGAARLAIDSADGHGAAGALVVEVSGNQPAVIRHQVKLAADSGAVYSVEGFGRIRSTRQQSMGGAMSLQLAWFDAEEKPVSTSTQKFVFDATDLRGWIRIARGWMHHAYSPPAKATHAYLEVVCQPPGGPFVFDDLRVESVPANELRAIQNRDAVSLNGKWQMLPRPWTSTEKELPQPDQAWQDIYLPGLPAVDRSSQSVWFRRTFDIPEKFHWQRIVLRLERAHSGCVAFINGQRIGGKIDPNLPMEFDATAAIQRGKPNEILLFVPSYLVTYDPPINPALSYVAAREYATAHPAQRTTHAAHWDWENTGIPGDIALLGSGQQFVESVYVRSALNPTRITVTGQASQSDLNVSCDVLDGDKVALELPRTKLSDGQFHCAADGPNLGLWWPETPKLYTLRVRLLEASGNIVDEYRERFGIRTTETRGDVMLLNGVPMRVFYSSNWFPTYRLHDPYSRTDLVKFFQFLKSINCPAHRTHATAAPRVVYQAADEAGVLIIAEPSTPLDHLWEREGYFEDFYGRWITMTRNNPSIVLRSLMNEYFSESDRAAWYATLRKPVTDIIALARRLQPDLPITFESDLDVYGMMDVIGMHYPDSYPSQQNWPEELYWTSTSKHVMTPCYVNGQFKWDRKKPLFIGEFGWQNWNSPDLDSMMLGDAAYHETFDNTRGAHDIARALGWFGMIEAYRNQGVTGMGAWTLYENSDLSLTNPLVMAIKQCYAPIVAFGREYHGSGFGGTTAKRTLLVHNDTLAAAKITVKWTHQIAVDWRPPDPTDNAAFANADAWRSFSTLEEPSDALLKWKSSSTGSNQYTLSPTQIQKMPVGVALPDVAERQRGRLKIEVERDGTVVWTGYRALDVWPERVSSGSLAVVLYDPKHLTGDALRHVGVRASAVSRISSIPADARVFVIGRDGLDEGLAREKEVLWRWVEAGGRVVCLEQANWANWLPFDFPKPVANVFSVAHIRAPGHPMLASFTTTDLRFWLPDNVVTRYVLKKPATGPYRALVDVTDGNGLECAGAVEVPWGKGAFIFNMLAMSDRAGVDPAAGMLLRETLRYAASDAPAARSQVVIRSADGPLKSKLSALKIGADGIEELDASGDSDRFRSVISDGATLYLHDIDDDGLRFLGSLLGCEVKWIEADKVPLPMHVVGNSPVTWGISSQDLYWTDRTSKAWIKPSLPNRQRGISVISDAAKMLVSGGLLVEVPFGKGRIVIDQVPWHDPAGNAAQATRYLNTLMTNLKTTSGRAK